MRPDHQHRGVGSMLVRSGAEAADRLSLPIALIAMGAKAAAMYKKVGFELLDELSIDLRPWGRDADYDTYIMVRPAKKG